MAGARRSLAHGRVRPVESVLPRRLPPLANGARSRARGLRQARAGRYTWAPIDRAAIFELTGSLLLTGAQRPAVGFKAQAIGFSDTRDGMQGRCVWTDEHGEMVYSELKGEWVGSGNHIVGTFVGGTGRYAGVTGDYTFQWQYVVDAEDGAVSGRVVDLKGRARLGRCAPLPRRQEGRGR